MPSSSCLSFFRAIPSALGEGVLWHVARQSLFWIDIESRRIFETRLEGETVRNWEMPERIGTIVPAADGGLVAALQSGIFHVDLASGVTAELVRPAAHDPQRVRFNDGKCDALGRLWVGTMGLQNEPGAARLYRITPDRDVQIVREHVTVSNGLAWSPDARTLYYIDSPTRVVQAFDFDLEAGTLTHPRIAIELGETPGFPDGCTIDAEGHLWIAHWGGGRVTRWDPQRGTLLDTLLLPVSNVTNCTFGGPSLDQLFITTASHGLDAAARAKEPEAGFLFHAEVGTRGLPSPAFGPAVKAERRIL